jgi:two-component system, OmpR family, KDP operon response regulator KdpE
MSPESPAVLIAAENQALRRSIRDSLEVTGFSLSEAGDTQAALDLFDQWHYDLALLDLNLPQHGAAEACRRLRAVSRRLGIIVIRAGGTMDDERAVLEAGADDCVVVPFRFREMVARIGAVRRRTPPVPVDASGVLRARDLELDLRLRSVRRRGREIHLSPAEFDLLAVLMIHPGSALTHRKLVWSAWGTDSPHNRAYLRTYIKTLRQKIEDNPADPRFIVTQAWVGYAFGEPVAVDDRADRVTSE